MSQQKIINTEDLICMNQHSYTYNYQINLAYSKTDNLLFGEQIYKSGAKLWLHRTMAEIVFIAAKNCFKTSGFNFVLYDGLRTTDAQEAMLKTKRVIDNPQWLKEPRLLSSTGYGGHPRGMAIDIGLINPDGNFLDMGTDFDYLAQNPDAYHNPAHREYKHPQNIIDNRKILDDCMVNAAKELNTPLLPLPQEWWDFRLPPEIYEQYKPISDGDLPKNMQLTNI